MARLIHLNGPPRVGKSTLPATEVEAQLQEVLVDPGSDLVDRIRGHLAAYLAIRPQAALIDTTDLGEDTSYARLLDVLDGASGSDTSGQAAP